MKNKSRKILLFIMILLLLLAGGYFLVIYKGQDTESLSDSAISDADDMVTTNDVNLQYIEVEQGDEITWDSERTSFYIPKGWTYEITTNDQYLERVEMFGANLSLKMEYLPVEDGSLWSNQDNVIYETSTSRLFKEDGIYKAIFNASTTVIEDDYEAGESESLDYGLFLTIKKNDTDLSVLTDEEFSYIKFVLDSYDSNNQY